MCVCVRVCVRFLGNILSIVIIEMDPTIRVQIVDETVYFHLTFGKDMNLSVNCREDWDLKLC